MTPAEALAPYLLYGQTLDAYAAAMGDRMPAIDGEDRYRLDRQASDERQHCYTQMLAAGRVAPGFKLSDGHRYERQVSALGVSDDAVRNAASLAVIEAMSVAHFRALAGAAAKQGHAEVSGWLLGIARDERRHVVEGVARLAVLVPAGHEHGLLRYVGDEVDAINEHLHVADLSVALDLPVPYELGGRAADKLAAMVHRVRGAA